MKITNINEFRKTALCAACVLLAAGAVEAKPDKGKDKGGKGGSPGHSEKENGGGKHDYKGKPDKHDDVSKDIEKAHKEARKEDEKSDKEFAKWREKRFRDDDRDGVLRYFSGYRDNEYGLPPGLAKNYRRGKGLPPGWQKKLVNGYVIEDDWNDRFHPLEYSLFPRLEAVPDTRLYMFGNRIVRVYEPRREVIDVITVPTIRYE